MKYITNNTAIILYIGGKPIRVEKTDKVYPSIIKAFQLAPEAQETEVLSLLNRTTNPEEVIAKHAGFEIGPVGDGDTTAIFYNGEQLPRALSNKVLSIIKDGLPLEHFEKFWLNLEQNPSSSSVEELMDFLEYKELPITEDGHFIAYKGVNNDYYSVHGNLNTKVLQGTVDAGGHIYNGLGEVLEVRRRDVDDNRDEGCSTGLHIGSLNYAKDWGSRRVIVKVNPRDVVSVPKDESYQKCRVTKYEVIGEFVEEITASVVDELGDDTLTSIDVQERSEFVDKVEKYLDNKRKSGFEEVTLRQIQNSFSPGWATKQQVLDALQELEETWTGFDNVIVINL